MIDSLTRPFRAKAVDDIYINISHFLDHFIMLIFAKAAYDAGRHFGFSYNEVIVYGALGFVQSCPNNKNKNKNNKNNNKIRRSLRSLEGPKNYSVYLVEKCLKSF